MSKALNKQRQLATSALRGKEMYKKGKERGNSSNYQHERIAFALIRFVL